MFGVDRFRSKHLVMVLKAVVDKAPVDSFGQAVLYDMNIEQWGRRYILVFLEGM